ncbi:MAG: alpha/beta fold hydrolase [Actinobacteria bacterium]|nr:alpha/beta fold hydrolase [Actinomycetota bacterium]
MTEFATTPILLVHGFAQTPKSWQTVIETIAGARPVHAIELPGHGATGLKQGEPTVDSVRAHVARYIADRAISPVVLWGYSQGARVVFDYALEHSDDVAAVIVESGTAGIDDPLARADRRSRDYALSKRLENSTIRQFVELWEKVPALTDQSRELIEAQRDDRMSHDPKALAQALRGIGQSAYEPMWDRLPEIHAPLLAISGARDRLYTDKALRIAECVPGAKHVTIKDAGHSVHMEQPEATVRQIESFLSLHGL